MKEKDYITNMKYVDGITVIDRHGRILYSVKYNPRFDKDGCEGEFQSIINKNFLEIYPSVDPNESTMVNCIKYGKPIYLKEQAIKDYRGEFINNENLTIPIIRSGKTLGAIELSRDITKINEDINPQRRYKSINIGIHKPISKAMYNFDDIITSNEKMLHNIQRAKIIANSSSSILIYGETGTGKELFAQSIHNYSNRRLKPFVAQNCAALPENLFESILFGSVRGAFTGSVDRPGLFEEAHGGTLFLDEINSMPLNLQTKLLRVLQDGRVRRVGDNKDKKVDVRIITAMNVEPTKAIELGITREDLFYRLSVVNITLVPLKERKEDIKLYVDYFMERYNKILNKKVLGISEDVKALFYRHNWPGNVRELQHIIEYAINFVEDEEIKLEHLPVYLSEKTSMKRNNNDKDDYMNNYFEYSTSLDDTIKEVEKELIVRALKKSGGNISKAANILKITRQRLHYKIDKYSIEFL